jgi:2,4-dienoyl-CoA reductase-like NADH-dependent reductase (Old Yellow Enzyme family)/thioredoxin reductase
MGNKLEYIFEPIKIGPLVIKNRIEFAPACFMLATHDGYATREMVAYYKNIAKGGAGIVTIGETPIDKEYAQDHEFMLNLGDDKVINGLSNVVEAVQKYGAVLSAELNHSGRFKLNDTGAIGPSPIPTDLEEELAAAQGRPVRPVIEMDLGMIDHVGDNFADAALRCYKAGMKMIMIHAGHGHLIAQFLSPYSNHRTDGYGGSLHNRAKFCIEVLDKIRARVGNKMAIEMRISANELTKGGMVEEDVIEFVRMIEDKIDLLHVSAGLLGNNRIVPDMIQPAYWPHCHNVHRAARLKKELNIPIATVGSIMDLETADQIIKDGKADIVAMARSIIVDPEIVNKGRQGRLDDIKPCMRCFNCNKRTRDFYAIRCALNPVIGRELDYAEIARAPEKKKIVVVGGGPGGMEAARTASRRGHSVVLYEKSAALGGNMKYAAALGIKEDLKRYCQYAIRQTEKDENIDIRLNAEATPDIVEKENPDAIIVAVGADAIIPDVPGVDMDHVVWVGDADAGESSIGRKVVVLGGGATGAEAALQMAIDGKDVTVVDVLDYNKQLAPSYPRGLKYKLEDYRINIIDHSKLYEVTEKGVSIISKDLDRHFIEADTVILSLGFRPRKDLAASFELVTPNTYYVGDCVNVGEIYNAVHDGFDLAVEL